MKTISTSIIPVKPIFYGRKETLDFKAICVYCALGFFIDDDTFYLEQKVLKPATTYTFNDNGDVISKNEYFKWYHNPRDRSLNQLTEEFSELFESIIAEQVKDKKVILPLSGGLDSRTQATALKYLNKSVNSYSYEYEKGHKETKYSENIAKVCDFPFQSWTVPEGYLWDKIEDLALLNKCYTDFTHPRQVAFSGNYSKLGDIFSLGHWGDVLFDTIGVDDNMPLEKQVKFIINKIVKKSGLELALDLWEIWDLEGEFNDYLYQRIKALINAIDIKNSANTRIRAFKSMYWAPRWTSTNLSIFEQEKPITLPYYDNRMCKFICEISEQQLSNRQIQIEYIKLRSPQLAKITWQDHRPFNLYNYKWNRSPYNIPYRLYNKMIRTLTRKEIVQRNWELQFLGVDNNEQLKNRLFNNNNMNDNISNTIINKYYDKFIKEDNVVYSHAVGMLLSLSLFFNRYKND